MASNNLFRVIVAVLIMGLAQASSVVAQPAKDADVPWGAPVDGLACRLVLQPRYVIGQAITGVIEVKNMSDKKRYFINKLNPDAAVKHLTIAVTGPGGDIRQTGFEPDSGPFAWIAEQYYQPIDPGEIKRYEFADLRYYFSSLNDWRCLPERKVNPVATGKYSVQMKFRSPKFPDRFKTSLSFDSGKAVYSYKDIPAEMKAGEWAREIAAAPVSFELAPLGKDDLVVHEWGVFTVFNDAKYANINRKEEWGSLPTFFYRQFPTERLRWAPSAWDKPIIYFYAKPALLRVNVKVTFSDGAPVAWWPAAADPLEKRPYETGPDPSRPQPFRSLTWEAWLGANAPPLHGPGPLAKVADFPLPDDCWLKQARLSEASQLTVLGNLEKGRRFPGALDRPETERFIYYDGLVPAPNFLRCEKVDDGSVTLRNGAKFDIPHLFVVDRRVKGTVRFAFLDAGKEPFKAGSSKKFLMQIVADKDWPAAGIKQVRHSLVESGLFEPEAESLLKIWHKGFFESAGVTVFHILPGSEYDRMLPLDILPAPAGKPVRVGIALQPHMEIEPGLVARVAGLVRRLDDENFARRDAAKKELLEIGFPVSSLLRAELNNNPSAEVRSRIHEILERVEVTPDWLRPAATTDKKKK